MTLRSASRRTDQHQQQQQDPPMTLRSHSRRQRAAQAQQEPPEEPAIIPEELGEEEPTVTRPRVPTPPLTRDFIRRGCPRPRRRRRAAPSEPQPGPSAPAMPASFWFWGEMPPPPVRRRQTARRGGGRPLRSPSVSSGELEPLVLRSPRMSPDTGEGDLSYVPTNPFLRAITHGDSSSSSSW